MVESLLADQPAVFEIIVTIDFQADDEINSLLGWLGQPNRSRSFPKILVVGSHALSDRCLKNHERLLASGVSEILERPINLQRLRYLIESQMIEFQFYCRRQERGEMVTTTSLRNWRRQLEKVAKVDTNILLTGETGVGKTFWARKIHEQSRREGHPFVVVNCGNIAPTLVESQLFGHLPGAFTGANRKQAGQFLHAGKGTIFLDDVDSLSLELQAKLLRVVENREFCPLGAAKPVAMLARIISASNRDLETLVAKGEFRNDLYFRLNAYEVQIPPLRERRDEVAAFCKYFAKEFARENGFENVAIDEELIPLLQQYGWPGNIRELRNCIQYAAIDSVTHQIHRENLPPRLLKSFSRQTEASARGTAVADEDEDSILLEEVDLESFNEVRRLAEALKRNNFNRSKAARDLGVSRMTVYNMLRRHDLG